MVASAYIYDDADRLTSLTHTKTGGAALAGYTYAYDALGRQIQVTQADPDGAGSQSAPVTSRAFDAAGQLISTTDPLGRTTSYEYDQLGRRTKVTQPDPDGAGAQLAPWTVFGYDAVGNLLTQTDRLSQQMSFAYDALYRQTSQTDANGDTTTFAFDLVGNRTSLTDPENNTTSWVYDGLDRVTSETNELNASRYFEYDAVGNLIQKIDRNDRYTQYEYDNLYRRTEERWLDPTDDTTVVHTIDWTYDAASQLTEAGDSFAEYDYTLDNLGRSTSIAAALAGLTPVVTLAQQFDANSRRTQLAATIGSTADFQNDYSFDSLNRMTRITQQDVTGGNVVADKRVDFGYNAAGQFDSISRYKDLTGTTLAAASDYSYDGTGRLTGLAHTKSGGVALAGYTLAYDAANRITNFANTQYTSETAAINYDASGQLTGADRTGTADDESYDYDSNGNRETANGATYTTGVNNQLTSDGTYNYEYDAEGNRTKQTNIATGDYRTFTWDHRNRLVAVTDFDSLHNEWQRIEYAYDFQQHLVGRKVFLNGSSTASESQHFVFDGDQMTLVMDDAGAVEHRYLWGPAVDQILADEVDITTSGYEETSWALTDHLNTVRDWVAEETANPGTFSVENHITLDTFGRNRAQSNAAAVDHLLSYTARYTDPLTGLQWNLHRWYDPQVGRWLSEDPIGFLAAQANLSVYVGNSATISSDPLGLEEVCGPIVWVYTGSWCVEENVYDAAINAAGEELLRIQQQARTVVRNLANAVADEIQAANAAIVSFIKEYVNAVVAESRNKGTATWQDRFKYKISSTIEIAGGIRGRTNTDFTSTVGLSGSGRILAPLPIFAGARPVFGFSAAVDAGIECDGTWTGTLSVAPFGGARWQVEGPWGAKSFFEAGVYGSYTYYFDKGAGNFGGGVYARGVIDIPTGFDGHVDRYEFRYTRGLGGDPGIDG